MRSESDSLKRQIEAVFELGKKLALDDASQVASAHMAKLSCVLACGYLEASCRDIFSSYCQHRSNAQIYSYVESSLNGFQNPNMEKILKLVGSFDKQSRETLERFVEGRLKSAVDSIVNNKNLIAHGRDSGISLVMVKGYYAGALEVANKLRALFPATK